MGFDGVLEVGEGEAEFLRLDDDALQDLAHANAPMTPDDPLENPADQIVVSPILDTIAAPDSTSAPPPTRFSGAGASGASYALTFSWTDVHSLSVLTSAP